MIEQYQITLSEQNDASLQGCFAGVTFYYFIKDKDNRSWLKGDLTRDEMFELIFDVIAMFDCKYDSNTQENTNATDMYEALAREFRPRGMRMSAYQREKTRREEFCEIMAFNL